MPGTSGRAARFVWRMPVLAIGLLSMAYATWVGLVRLGWNLPLPQSDQLVVHGPLMICGFLGTLIFRLKAEATLPRKGGSHIAARRRKPHSEHGGNHQRRERHLRVHHRGIPYAPRAGAAAGASASTRQG